MAAIQPDFFNNACTVIPLLLLAKVAERARRRDKDSGEGLHVSFIVAGFAAEGIALWGSQSRSTIALWVLVGSLVFCVVLFVAELVITHAPHSAGD